MLQSDIERMKINPDFSLDQSDLIYVIFQTIGIIGYFAIPTVVGWIMSAGGIGNLGKNVSQTVTRGGAIVGGASAGNILGRLKGK